MSEYSLSALRVGQSAYVAEIQADEACAAGCWIWA